MKLNPKDTRLVQQFLFREAQDYKWVKSSYNSILDAFDRRSTFCDKMYTQIREELEEYTRGADFVEIQSLTGLGQVQRKLCLTPVPWDWKGGRIIVCLPPSPRGGVSSCREGEIDT